MRARAPIQSWRDELDVLENKPIRFVNSEAKCKKMMLKVNSRWVGIALSKGVVFGDGVEGEDVADEVFEHLIVFDEA